MQELPANGNSNPKTRKKMPNIFQFKFSVPGPLREPLQLILATCVASFPNAIYDFKTPQNSAI